MFIFSLSMPLPIYQFLSRCIFLPHFLIFPFLSSFLQKNGCNLFVCHFWPSPTYEPKPPRTTLIEPGFKRTFLSFWCSPFCSGRPHHMTRLFWSHKPPCPHAVMLCNQRRLKRKWSHNQQQLLMPGIPQEPRLGLFICFQAHPPSLPPTTNRIIGDLYDLSA